MHNPLQRALDWLVGEPLATPRGLPDFGEKPQDSSVKRSLVAPEKEALRATEASAPGARLVLLDGRPVAYVLERARRRSIGLSLSPQGLRVRAPIGVSLAQVEAVLQDKAHWILRKQVEVQARQTERNAARQTWCDGAPLPLLGDAVALDCDRRASVGARRVPVWLAAPGGCPPTAGLAARLEAARDHGERARLCVGLPPEVEPARLQAVVQRWLQQQARLHFTERLAHFAPQLGVRPTRLALSNAATRWGSASADGSIRLHWRLIQLRPALIDYVVVHELSHLRHMDHSPRFWAVVASVLPDHRALRAELRRQAVVMED